MRALAPRLPTRQPPPSRAVPLRRPSGPATRPPCRRRHSPQITRVVPPDILPPAGGGGGGDGDPVLFIAGLALAAVGALVMLRVLLWDYKARPTNGEDTSPDARLDTRLSEPTDNTPRRPRPAGLAAALSASAAAVASARSLAAIREAKAAVAEATFDEDVQTMVAAAPGTGPDADPLTLAATASARRAQMVAVAAAAVSRGASAAAARKAAVTRVAALAVGKETAELLRAAKDF